MISPPHETHHKTLCAALDEAIDGCGRKRFDRAELLTD
jgi:hypothetical protein